MMELRLALDEWPLNEPFVTSKDHVTHIETLTVNLDDGRYTGHGEALGVDYLGETAESMAGQLEALREGIESGVTLVEIQQMLPAGGARNGLDCALWDLECKRQGRRAWDLLAMPVAPLTTLYTLSLASPDEMARQALEHPGAHTLKLKLNDDAPAEKLRAVRAARPDAELVIDANGGWDIDLLLTLGPVLADCGVAMLEQPLDRGKDEGLVDVNYPVPLCADESCQSLAELDGLAARYDMVNIKLDKCGGLSEAMAMIQQCRESGMPMMVGNMLGSSLAMAPAFLVAQFCRWVDLDGPLWQSTDREHPMRYENYLIHPPAPALWG